MADGATETSFAAEWAALLADNYLRHGQRAVTNWLRRAQFQWQRAVAERPLPWYAEEKARAGAYAALIGLEIRRSGRWSALAVGDCVLMYLRDGQLRLSFPLTRSTDFGNRPALLGSRTPLDALTATPLLRTTGGDWQPGDRFYLMSDALAAWFLSEAEAGAQPWQTLDHLLADKPECFSDWLCAVRRQGYMRNDDVTIQRIALEAEPPGELADTG